MASRSSSSFTWRWVCHECNDGPHNYANVTSCTNVLGNGSICQHKLCPRCITDKDRIREAFRIPVTSAGSKELMNATSDPDDSRNTRRSTPPVSGTATSVPEESPSIGECTSPDPTSDSEPPSNTSPEATPASDTSSEDSTNGLSQAERTLISVVARRLVDGWASRFQTGGYQPASNVRTRPGESSGSAAPNFRRQRNSASSPDAVSALNPVNNPDCDSDDPSDQPQKRRRRQLNHDPEEDSSCLRLLACPYQKYDPQRYSERNVLEKEYRGCASCFITDINRLKYLPPPFLQPVLTFNQATSPQGT